MSEIKTLEIPVVRPRVEIDAKTKRKLKVHKQEESQVVVHCVYHSENSSRIRLWKTTYLLPHDSSFKAKLVHAEGIDIYPEWSYLELNEIRSFTLYFSALPKSCKSFDLHEIIPEPGGFRATNIRRNYADVYHIKIN